MKKTFIILFCVLPVIIGAQVTKEPFISGGFGAYNSGSGYRLNDKNSSSLVFSTGFGLPLYKQVFLYTRLSYISRSNYTASEYHSFIDGNFNTVNELVEVDASFSQLLMNGGLQYNISIAKEWVLGLSGGITYALVNHKANLPNGLVLQQLDNAGIFGVFSGVSLEKSFEDSNAAIFGEAQYNYAKRDVVYFRDKFSGMNFTVGARYYFE